MLSARHVMRQPVHTVPLISVDPECSLRRCATLMTLHRIRRLPVAAAGRPEPIGMVSDADVFDALLNFHTEAALSASL